MCTIDIQQAQTDLEKLIDLVGQDKEVIITREGKPVAKLTKPLYRFGVLKGKIKISKDFDAPLNIL